MRTPLAIAALAFATALLPSLAIADDDIEQEVAQCRKACFQRCAKEQKSCGSAQSCQQARKACNDRCINVECMT